MFCSVIPPELDSGKPPKLEKPLAMELVTVEFFNSDRKTSLGSVMGEKGKLLINPIPPVTIPLGEEFAYWNRFDGGLFDFATTPVETDMKVYAVFRPIQSYTVRFMQNYNTVVQKVEGYKIGDTIGSKISALPNTGLAEADYYDANLWQNTELTTVVNRNMDIYPKAYRKVTFQGYPGSSQTDPITYNITTLDSCFMPPISLRATVTNQDVTIETSHTFVGWFDGTENKGTSGSFTPARKNTTLMPQFTPPNTDLVTVKVYTAPLDQAAEPPIVLGPVSVDAVVMLDNVITATVGGKQKTGWETTVNSNATSFPNTNSIPLNQTGAQNGAEIVIVPVYGVIKLNIRFEAPYGFRPGTPPADYYNKVTSTIDYGATAGLDKAVLDKRVQLPVPNPLTYYTRDEDGEVVREDGYVLL